MPLQALNLGSSVGRALESIRLEFFISLVVWVRAPPGEKTLLLLLSHGFTSKSYNGAMQCTEPLKLHFFTHQTKLHKFTVILPKSAKSAQKVENSDSIFNVFYTCYKSLMSAILSHYTLLEEKKSHRSRSQKLL